MNLSCFPVFQLLSALQWRPVRLLLKVGVLLGSTLSMPYALAQNFDAVRLYHVAPGTSGGSAGVAAVEAPAYPGADRERSLLRPTVNYHWASGWFAGTENGLGVNLSSQPDLAYGARLTADTGRSEDRSYRLHGLGDIPFRPEIGAFANYAPTERTILTTSLRYGAGNDRRGLVLDAGILYAVPISAPWSLGLQFAVTWADSSFMRSYFGVGSSQEAASGYTLYQPTSGLEDARVAAALSYQLRAHLVLTGVVSATRYMSRVTRSPIVARDAAVSFVELLTYSF